MAGFDPLGSIIRTIGGEGAGFFYDAVNNPAIDLMPGVGKNENMRRGILQNYDPNAVYGIGEQPKKTITDDSRSLDLEGNQGGSGVSSSDISYLDDQSQQLRDLLARTETGLSQGLTQNQDQYDTQLGQANGSKDLQYANYADQRVGQNKAKLGAYDQINQGANRGYNSLAQIIGRASGTGSSAFRDLLPNVIGKDTSSKRQNATNTYGQNLQGIDKAQGQYDISFQSVLDDLMKQKKDNENNLRTGIEGQRQRLNSQLATSAAQKAQALGGGYAQVKAASQPFQDAINNSRNTVQSFFDQYRTPYTQKQAVATAPDLSQYTVDRSNVNAQSGTPDEANNPYAALLRKKLQGQA